MTKIWLSVAGFILITAGCSAQTLFTFGTNKADAREFVKAFNKNNTQANAANRSKAMREYLDLYINSRLKITEAYNRGYDTLPQIKSEVENLRNQIIETYMSDPETIDRLSQEAFQRSLKDVHVAYIYINSNNDEDTIATKKKLTDIEQRLKQGEDFKTLAEHNSDDPSAPYNRGDLSWITVFSLPYALENVVYTTTVGKYSAPFHNKSGYYIFKNLGERKAIGKVKAQQILLAFPPDATAQDKNAIGKLADSLYKRVVAGDDFAKLAARYSNDATSAASNGMIHDIAVGQYDGAFENMIWSMPKNVLSKPFQTAYGYHLIRKTGAVPVVTNAANKENQEQIKQKILLDERWKTAKDFIYTAVMKKPGIKNANYPQQSLWMISDSLLNQQNGTYQRDLTSQSSLFSIGNEQSTVDQWILFAQANRYTQDRSGTRPYADLMHDFKQHAMYQYYRDHLEEFNPAFSNQMSEFRDGNLFFEIMQQEIWNRAQTDSAALIQLYNNNRSNYTWNKSADAVIFFCSDAATARIASEGLKKNMFNWRKAISTINDKVVADSARYEWNQLPGLPAGIPRSQTITKPVINPTDNTASFAYLVNVYTASAPRTFNEAKGMVMNDYQTLLETQWINSLRKKYPVVIDEKVFAGLTK